jgi:hypothetical protein
VKGKEIEVEKMPKNAPMPFGLLIVDIFTKYVNVVPLFDNQGPNVVAALQRGIQNMGGKPKTIYCDGEGAFVGKDIQEYLLKENIRMINSRNHAPYAERHIRTIKDMINRRLEYKKLVTKKWVDILPDILKEYNNKMVHSSHKFTPEQARQRRNEATIKGRLEVKRISDRKYPEVEEGDTVRAFKSKDKMSKQNVPAWSETLHKVVRIQETHGQKIYTVDPVHFQWRRPLVRSDILLISRGTGSTVYIFCPCVSCILTTLCNVSDHSGTFCLDILSLDLNALTVSPSSTSGYFLSDILLTSNLPFIVASFLRCLACSGVNLWLECTILLLYSFRISGNISTHFLVTSFLYSNLLFIISLIVLMCRSAYGA